MREFPRAGYVPTVLLHLPPMDFRGISDFSVKATSAEIGRVSITISLCLDEYAQFCGGGRCWPIA